MSSRGAPPPPPPSAAAPSGSRRGELDDVDGSEVDLGSELDVRFEVDDGAALL